MKHHTHNPCQFAATVIEVDAYSEEYAVEEVKDLGILDVNPSHVITRLENTRSVLMMYRGRVEGFDPDGPCSFLRTEFHLPAPHSTMPIIHSPRCGVSVSMMRDWAAGGESGAFDGCGRGYGVLWLCYGAGDK